MCKRLTYELTTLGKGQNMETLKTDHVENLPRLNRITGQITGVKKMIEEKRPTPDILIQLKAIRAAVRSVETNMMKKHLYLGIQVCAADADSDEMLEDLKKLFDRFYE